MDHIDDTNGSIVLRDPSGAIRRYSEKYISSTRELLNTMHSEDAHDLGYRVGFRDGFRARDFKNQAKNILKKNFKKFAPIFRMIK